MKTARSSRVPVSCGRRRWNRITPSGERGRPARITSPITSSAFANIDPRMEVSATTTWPARRANSTTNSSGRLPSDDCRTPVTAGPKRRPTVSVAAETTQASPASAMPETTNDRTDGAPA